jgi:signal transduction histidine kinase
MVRPKSSVFLVGLLLILLPVFAILQYRWIGEVSAAERDRLETSLRDASNRFASDLDQELARLSNGFQIRDGFPESGQPLLQRYQSWSESAAYPQMVHAIDVVRTSPDAAPEFYKLDMRSGELQPSPLPKELENFRERLRPGPLNLVPSSDTMMLFSPIFRGGPAFGPRGGQDLGARGRGEFRQRRPDDFRARGQGPGPGPARMEGATLIELDRSVILKELVPALVERHFLQNEETEYRVAIAAGTDHPEILYSSQGQWTSQDIAKPDESVFLLGTPPRPNPGERRGGNPRNRVPGPFIRNAFQVAAIGAPWQLLVKHRSGSLERAVEGLRTRNLAISFGIMLVLGAGLITVVISSQRARTLGKQQVEFAAGISHELRTPLAVIRSAAYNLSRGIVHDKEGVEQYASIVQDEARRLSDMVDQVLLYSETQSGRKKYNLAPVDVTEVIDRALTNLSPATAVEESELTTSIPPDLPAVQADASALTQCVQNLLSNALKYGKTNGNIQIEIAAEKDNSSNEVRLSITDHGPGIDPADERHLFEPFYRGVHVGSNVPGNGLGLHLVKSIMQAQNGRVTFSPAPGGGARFTLHIPAAQ